MARKEKINYKEILFKMTVGRWRADVHWQSRLFGKYICKHWYKALYISSGLFPRPLFNKTWRFGYKELNITCIYVPDFKTGFGIHYNSRKSYCIGSAIRFEIYILGLFLELRFGR